MPRNYMRKTDKASYSREQLQEAIQLVKNGTLSAYAASKHYGIPRPTIVNRIYGRRGVKSNTLGRSTVLAREVEESLVKNLHVMEKYGFGLSRKEIIEAVGQYIKANGIDSPFKDGVPGEEWFLGFKKRHGLSVKKPQPVEFARKNAIRPDIIYPYFDLLENTLNELNLQDKPANVWNLDETSFSKDPSKSKVVGLKGFTSTRTISSPGKDNTTVLLGCNALGEKTPPLIIYKGKDILDQWTSQEAYPGTVYAATANGWMETPVFETFFEKVFLPTVGEKRPILLIYDGHSTHVGINIIEKARAAGITILKIPPHTSHVLQPLDLAVNKSFKDKWDTVLVKWQRQHIGKVLPKKDFAKMIGQIWTAVEPTVCSAGFRKAGIYPLNKNVVPEEKFNQILLKEWKSRTITSQKTNDAIDREPTCTFDQPEQLQKLVLASLNTVISRPRTGVHQQSSNNQGKYNLKKQWISTELSPAVQIQTDLQQSGGASSKYNLYEPPMSTQQELYEKFSFPSKNVLLVPKDHDIMQKNTAVLSYNSYTNEKDKSSCNAKIQILDDRPVKFNISFEDLLLESIKCESTFKTKRTKIATGAELITHDEVYNRCKSIEAEKEQKAKQKEQKLKEKEQKAKEKEQKAKEKEQRVKEKRQNARENAMCKVQKSSKDKEKKVKDNIFNTKEMKKVKAYQNSKNKNLKKRMRSRSSSSTLSNYSLKLDDSSDYNLDDEFDFDIISDISKENIQYNENDMDAIMEYSELNDTTQRKQINKNTEYNEKGDLIMSHQSRSKKIELRINTVGYLSDENESCDDKKDMHYCKRQKTGSVRTITEKTDQEEEEDKTERDENKIYNTCVKEIHKTEKEQILPIFITPIEETRNILEKTNIEHIKEKQTILPKKNNEKMMKIKFEKTNIPCREWIVGDTILTRYYSRGNWRYYIGVITEIDYSKSTYKVSYFKTNKHKQGITFVKPKREDIDIIPEDVIVKLIELLQINENPEFVLIEDEDIVYFS